MRIARARAYFAENMIAIARKISAPMMTRSDPSRNAIESPGIDFAIEVSAFRIGGGSSWGFISSVFMTAP